MVENLRKTGAHVNARDARNAFGRCGTFQSVVVVRVQIVFVDRFGRRRLPFDRLLPVVLLALVNIGVMHHVNDVFDFVQGEIRKGTQR